MTVGAEGLIRRFVAAVIHEPWPKMSVRVFLGIIGGHVGMALILGVVGFSKTPNSTWSWDDFLAMCGALAAIRGFTGAFWGFIIVHALGWVRLPYLAGDKRTAARRCRVGGGGIVIALLFAHYWMGKMGQIVSPEDFTSHNVLRFVLMTVPTDFNLLCGLALVLAAGPLARGDWDDLLDGESRKLNSYVQSSQRSEWDGLV